MKLSPKQLKALKLIAEGRFYPAFVREEDGWYARWQAIGEENGWVDAFIREENVTTLTEDAEDQRHNTLHDAWMMALRSRTGLVKWEEGECAAFAAELREWSGDAAADTKARRAITFRFHAAGTPDSPQLSIACGAPRGLDAYRALGQAAHLFGPLRSLRRKSPTMLAVELSTLEAEAFVRQGAKALADASYTVEGVPKRAEVTAMAEISGEAKRERVSLKVKVAGQEVTAAELRFLLDQGTTFVYFRGHWVEIDRGILRAALKALERRGADRKTNLLSFAMGIGRIGSMEIDELKLHGWLRGLVNKLGGVGAITLDAGAIDGFDGTLREYQSRGVAWMRFLTDHGFGALLADDMGLGKTIQTIAWMLLAKVRPVLVVAPLTLLANWRHELKAFAPSLRVYTHHGNERRYASGFNRAVGNADVVLTSYSLLVREYRTFADVAWGAMVIDEAQAIKNRETQIAKAVCGLTPPKRIALTGTPIENSVADIWSIENFLNPGFLGDYPSFRERFVMPMAMDASSSASKRLRHALAPFVMRRLKTDRAIAAELGAKRELREYFELGVAARREYESALADYRALDHSAGDSLALLMRLKLVCDGADKLERLAELLERIFANGESALVFTQFVKVGAYLRDELAKRFGRRFPFLNGELSTAAREREIAAFNRGGSSAFILSLRAGGFGLNLTKATHVIHFDRWWNPSVENQATDRAHRIGQTKDVFVHLLIAAGTLEEHIDALLMKKLSLRDIVADGDQFWKTVKLDHE